MLTIQCVSPGEYSAGHYFLPTQILMHMHIQPMLIDLAHMYSTPHMNMYHSEWQCFKMPQPIKFNCLPFTNWLCDEAKSGIGLD